MIILVARIYLAHDIVRCLTKTDASSLPGFNFETYPILKDALDCLETRLQRICESTSSVAIKPKSATELLQSIASDVRHAKQRLVLAESAISEALECVKRRELHQSESEIESRVEERLEFMLKNASKKNKKQKTVL